MAKARRPSNREMMDQLDELLTTKARELLGEELLVASKPWRAELWKLTREVRRRMVPTEAGPLGLGDDDDKPQR